MVVKKYIIQVLSWRTGSSTITVAIPFLPSLYFHNILRLSQFIALCSYDNIPSMLRLNTFQHRVAEYTTGISGSGSTDLYIRV